MGFFQRLLNKRSKDVQINSNEDFWNWFKLNADKFHHIVKDGDNIEEKFFHPLSEALKQLGEGYFFVTGMSDDKTAELVLTPDGNLLKIAQIETLIENAPSISGWKLTALKSAMDSEDFSIAMGEIKFDFDSLSFIDNSDPLYPDEIIISIVHKDYSEENSNQFDTGIFIFLDNLLGELETVTLLDEVKLISPNEAKVELIPIKKLPSFLKWRDKEFIEKYEAVRYDTENDSYNIIEYSRKDGHDTVAVINTALIGWEAKCSHPWILELEINFEGNEGGMPYPEQMEQMNIFEDNLSEYLIDFDGYLNIGRETGGNQRLIYFACKDFRKPSTVSPQLIKEHSSLDVKFEIYKDKYWRSLEGFNVK
tara:strand:- start:145 stop:1239 length:1095 start_codon:yes stop_codon:yes gene_type:complete